ncbi:hypothetical protein PVAND_012816 [Polypedilum vanderplanki]|uniref:H15 domain-containing protein n=1 Tax=Polypedilum vanderplanki TaxID=319348 RepID=A0A9J6CPL8_POLVA|nr:hypothetical protein PVAND_012816 [Polypedilum vanderplanki]
MSSKNEHPPVKEMVFTAMNELDPMNSGISFKKIEKYLFEHYNVYEKIGQHIKVFLRKALDDELLVKKKGVGISGSFKRNLKKANKVAKNNRNKPATSSTKPKNVEKKTTSAKSKKTDNTPKKTAKKNVAKSTKALSKTTSKKSAAAATAKSKKTVETKKSKSIKK